MAKKKETKAAADVAQTPVIAKQTDAEKEGLKGPVKHTTETTYKAFLMNGKVIKGKIDGENYHTVIPKITYNEKGGRIVYEHLFLNGTSFIHNYNDEGLLIGAKHYKEGGILESWSTNEHNEQGKVIAVDCGNINPDLCSKSIFNYDDRDNVIEMNTYNAAGELTSKYINIYDEKGFRIASTSTKGDGTFSHSHKYKNDEKGRMIENTVYKEDGSVEKVYPHVFIFNDKDQVISYNGVVHVPQGFGETYEYENDSHGNWIKKTVFFKKVAINIVEREINYFGEELSKNEQSEMESLLMDKKEDASSNVIEEKKEIIPEIKQEKIFLKMGEEETKWLAAGSPTPDIFNAMRYYVLKNNVMPSEINYTGKSFEVMALMQLLKENLGAEVIHTYSNKTEQSEPTLLRYTMTFPGNEYMIQATAIVHDKANKYVVPQFIEGSMLGNSGYVYISPVMLFKPKDESWSSDESWKRHQEFEEKFKDFLEVCVLEKQPDKPVIYMVQTQGNAYSLKVHSVDDNFEITDLDLNYGAGFEKFHKELMKRFKDESKGLVLFHGQPGTGKTYYIRHLLRVMASKKKIVIYMPPNMVDHLVEPDFMTFISNTVEMYSKQGNFCVLLIEDAEPLLAARHSDTRIQGITNLLNMTDGLLNDMLNLQIICTFNVNVEKLDKALLRPGRLIARKEFVALPEFEANLLGSRLGIKYRFTKATSLSEIYAKMKDKNTLIHDIE